MGRNPEAKFSMINISLKNGNNYGCSAVIGTVIEGRPGITFISSGFPTNVFVEDIKEISVSIDSWCPRCE